jgi:hypothetical protein
MSALSHAEAPQSSFAGFILIAMGSAVAAVVLILAVPYYAGSSGRIASLYSNLADPADRLLAADLQAYAVNRRQNLAAAKQDLSNEVKTDTAFDNQLSQITFPPAADPHADTLTALDAKRIKLIKLQLQATSLRKLQAFDSRVEAASAAVDAQVRIMRQDLGLPPVSGGLY